MDVPAVRRVLVVRVGVGRETLGASCGPRVRQRDLAEAERALESPSTGSDAGDLRLQDALVVRGPGGTRCRPRTSSGPRIRGGCRARSGPSPPRGSSVTAGSLIDIQPARNWCCSSDVRWMTNAAAAHRRSGSLMAVVSTFTASLMRARPAPEDVHVSRTHSLLPAMKKPDELEMGDGSRAGRCPTPPGRSRSRGRPRSGTHRRRTALLRSTLISESWRSSEHLTRRMFSPTPCEVGHVRRRRIGDRTRWTGAW